MSNKASAAEDVDYEVLSRDTVREMHEKFMAGIDAKARKAVPENSRNPESLAKALQELLIACARKAIDIKPAALAEEAKTGVMAVRRHTADVRDEVHAKSPNASAYPSPQLSREQEREVAKAARKRKEDPAVLSTFGDEDRIYLRLKGGEDASVSDVREDIEWYLGGKGYSITDYAKGYATDDAGKQQFKIGRLLKGMADDTSWNKQFHETLLQEFIDDPSRTLGTLCVVISRNPADIANMSTGRAWSSCMGSGGFNWHYVPHDVREGTLIAYMVSEKDPDIVSPLGRVLMKPLRETQCEQTELTSAARRAFAPQQIFLLDHTYGIHNPYFTAAVEKFVEKNLNAGKNGDFELVYTLYEDEVPCEQSRRNGKVVEMY